MHTFEPKALETYLATHVEGFSSLDGFEKFSAGQSNPTYRVTSGSRDYVLRAQPLGTLLPSAHAVDREYRVMKALAGTVVPVPKMFHLCEDKAQIGSMFFVMEMVQGDVFWDPALPDLSRDMRTHIYDEMNRGLAALHSIDPSLIGLGDYGKPGNYFERQTQRWIKQYKFAETETVADADWVAAWLQDNMVADDNTVAIAHGDFRLDNMMFGPDGDLLAILDWELSTLGHPLADLAYQVMVWDLPNKGRCPGLGGVDRDAMGLPTDQDYVATYCERMGIEVPAHWNFYLTFACFRFVSILQGVLKRGLEGSASNPLGTDVLRGFVHLLAARAKSYAIGSKVST